MHRALRCIASAALAALLLVPLAWAQIPPQPPSVLDRATVEIGAATVQTGVVYARPMGFRPLRLDLYRPKIVTRPLPLVIWLHGGGWMVGDATGTAIAGLDWPATLAELAGRGYVVASVTYRLSGEARYPAQIHDVRAAIRWLRANASSFSIDASRVFATGGSAGAYLAVLAGVSCGDAALDAPTTPAMPARPGAPLAAITAPVPGSECIQGVVAFYPPIDLPLLAKVPYNGIPGESADSAVGRLLGCAMAICPRSLLASAAILARVDAKDPPMLLIHGDADTAVPIDQSRLLDAALMQAGVPTELMVVPGANHVLPGLAATKQREILDRMWRFLDQRSGR